MSQDCFHCGLPVPKSASYIVKVDHKDQVMCCMGCQSVAQVIVDSNLTDFYKHRTTKSSKPSDLIPAELQIYDNDALQESFVSFEKNDQDRSIREASLILEGIVCAACVWLNEHTVKKLEGVIDFRVNYSTHRASLKWDNGKIKLSDVLQAIAETGYSAHPFDPARLDTIHQKEKSAALRRIALAGMGMMQVMMPAIAIYLGENSDMTESMRNFLRWISLIITTPVVLYSSRIFFTSAWRDLKRGVFGMDVPVSLAVGSAYIASAWATVTNTGEVYFDSVVMFTFFLLLGRFLEMGARHKAGQVADALVRLLPQTATRIDLAENGKEIQTVIPASDLALGDQVLIKPGETIPADGSVIDGSSSANESLLTGENLPLLKTVGDELIGGSVNIESPLTMRVDKLGDSTMLSSIIRLLDRAQSKKPNLAKFADRSAGWFVLLLLLIAIAVFAVWWFIDPSRAFWIALSVLVITCPCALSLATPAALTAATGNLTEQGVLATRGHALETLAKITHVVFDKTGTLTLGRLKVVKIQLLGGKTKTECEALAAGLETASEHPLAKAIQKLSSKAESLVQISAESGRGVEGKLDNKRIRIGTKSYVAELAGDKFLIDEQASEFDSTNYKSASTAVYLGKRNEWLAVFYLQDEIRKEAKETIAKLKSAGIKVSLLSGDNQQAVQTVSQALGIDSDKTNAELLPADKLKTVQKWQASGDIVAMIGDGVNDAPVLAAADVSIAMGSGSQLAQASADMILLSENLVQLPASIKLSKRMQTIIYQNFAWAILYNVIAIPLAAMGWVAPWMAAIGMSMSSLVVILNALRLKA
jgi:Cu2+-exporting ATPase